MSASGRLARATLGVMGSPEEAFILFHLNIIDLKQCGNDWVCGCFSETDQHMQQKVQS